MCLAKSIMNFFSFRYILNNVNRYQQIKISVANIEKKKQDGSYTFIDDDCLPRINANRISRCTY